MGWGMTLPKISHSQIVEWRRCQQRWGYRYGQRLVPKRHERPLYVGNWVHSLLQAHYEGKDWRTSHASYVKQYDKMFEEEKLRLDKGSSQKKSEDRADYEPLPRQVERIMLSYLWYNRNDRSKTLAVEVRFELRVVDESDGLEYTFVGVIDRIKEDEDGLTWIEDHKIWGELPDESAFHTMDPQLTLYLNGAKHALGIEAAGVEYNYVQSVAPSLPSLNKDGSISKSEVRTDYPTLFTFLKRNGFDPKEYLSVLAPLAASSPFLRRYRMPRADQVTAQILTDTNASAREIINHTSTVRNITKQCDWCPYAQLCRGELFGLDMAYLRKDRFTIEGKRPTRELVTA